MKIKCLQLCGDDTGIQAKGIRNYKSFRSWPSSGFSVEIQEAPLLGTTGIGRFLAQVP